MSVGPVESELAPGSVVLGRYRVLRLLARGGMGAVYLGRTEGAAGFRRAVVIKSIRSGRACSDDAVRLFVREARIMAKLKHPGIVVILDFDEQDGAYLMVLEYVHGQNLDVWNRFHSGVLDRPFDVDAALHVTISVLEALAHAHDYVADRQEPLRLVHRDVKPSNILIGLDGTVKLADFGIARAAGEQTTTADLPSIKGTWAYVAPEIFAGSCPDARTDVYSCGVVLHEILAGRSELKGPDPAATVHNVLNHHPTLLDHLRGDVSTELAGVVDRALAKDPSRRFICAAALADALRRSGGHAAREVHERVRRAVQDDFHDSRLLALDGAIDLRLVESLLDAQPWIDRGAGDGRARRVDSSAQTTAPTAPEPPPVVVPDRAAGRQIGRWLTVLLVLGLATVGAVLLQRQARVPVEPSGRVPRASAEKQPVAAVPRATEFTNVRIEGAPPGTEVIGPEGEVLGLAPGLVRVLRSSGEVELRLRVPGRAEHRQRVSAASDSTVVVVIPDEEPTIRQPRVQDRATVSHRDEIEDPFRRARRKESR